MPGDSIADIGFLSPAVAGYITDHRNQYADFFGLADALNRVGQGVMSEANVTITDQRAADPKLLTLLLLIRTMSNFQGVILLVERGMIVEARTLARSCYENVYCLSALQKDGAGFVKAMLADELYARKAASNWLLQKPERLEFAGAGAAGMLHESLSNIEAASESTARHQVRTDRRACGRR
jgi:hypothetical protein